MRAYGDDAGALSRVSSPSTRAARPTIACWPSLCRPTSAPSSRCGATKGLGARGVQRALAAVRSFFRYLAREGIAGERRAARRAHAAHRAHLAAPAERKRCRAHAGRSGRARRRMAGARATWRCSRCSTARACAFPKALGLKRGDVPLGAIAQRARQGAQGTQRSAPAGGARSGGALCRADPVYRRARRRAVPFAPRQADERARGPSLDAALAFAPRA